MFSCTQDLRIDDYVKASIFAVFDGHGGDECAKFLKSNLYHVLRRRLKEKVKDAKFFSKTISDCLTETFRECDQAFRKARPEASYFCGATGVVVLIIGS